MNPELSNFAARLRGLMADFQSPISDCQFSRLALELFTLQFKHNPAYHKICKARQLPPATVKDWTQIPAVPTGAFKELELTSLPPEARTAVFHSSGTTEQKPSRHFHNAESLAVYEASLWENFKSQIPNFKFQTAAGMAGKQLAILTPPPAQATHSSLVHMFETICSRACESAESAFSQTRPPGGAEFLGKLDSGGVWTLDFEKTLAALSGNSKLKTQNSKLVLGTAFSFVHLLDFLAGKNLKLQLPEGSLVMETGGYKNRSRTMPKAELHALITDRLGVPRENILCEYGMSELSSQAYDSEIHPPSSIRHPRIFHFPPWVRVQIISPESGREVDEGETGLIRIFDLANVFSVAAIQTEDLGVRRGDGFELVGRAQLAEPRGCSLMNA